MAITKLRDAVAELLPTSSTTDNLKMTLSTLKLIDCTGATPITVFTVTGDVLAKIYAV